MRYKDGILIPESPLNLKNNSVISVILEDDIYNAFSLAGEESNIKDYLFAQKEVLGDEKS